jgi:PadR family transcriptional regulator
VPARSPESSPQTSAVLLALAGQPGWSYGYDLARATNLKSGTLYPMLARLARRGLLESSWESQPPEGRPRRHLYRLSAAGTELATNLSASPAVRRHGDGWIVPNARQV